MKKILIIGGGAMGSAFTFPCIDNKNEVTITEPYNNTFIKNLSSVLHFNDLTNLKKSGDENWNEINIFTLLIVLILSLEFFSLAS